MPLEKHCTRCLAAHYSQIVAFRIVKAKGLESTGFNIGRRQGNCDEGIKRATNTLQLVFNNTRPATRVPLTGWAVSGGGAGLLANAINDWLREHRAR